MTSNARKETTVGEVVTVARNLYNALLDARQYVSHQAHSTQIYVAPDGNSAAREALDRIDGALADAGEFLGGRTL